MTLRLPSFTVIFTLLFSGCSDATEVGNPTLNTSSGPTSGAGGTEGAVDATSSGSHAASQSVGGIVTTAVTSGVATGPGGNPSSTSGVQGPATTGGSAGSTSGFGGANTVATAAAVTTGSGGNGLNMGASATGTGGFSSTAAGGSGASAATGSGGTLSQASTLVVRGRHLYDRCGEQVVLRGVNEMIVWSGGRDGNPEFSEIAKTGANAVRIVWTEEGTAAELDAVITNALGNHLVPMVEHHGATGDLSLVPVVVDYWTRRDVVAVIKKARGFLAAEHCQ